MPSKLASSLRNLAASLLLAASSLNLTAQIWLPPVLEDLPLEQTPVEIVIAIKTGGNRSTATGAEEIIALVTDANLSGKPVEATEALGSPVAARFTFGRFDYPASVVIPETSAIWKMKQYVTLTYIDLAQAENAVPLLESDARFAYVDLKSEPVSFSPSLIPNDQFFGVNQYTPPSPNYGYDDSFQWGPAAMNMPGAWWYTQGWARIGILDAGIATYDPNNVDIAEMDLRGRLSRLGSYDFSFRNGSALGTRRIEFETGNRGVHGTHVSGIAIATPNNAVAPFLGGISGICQNCTHQHAAVLQHTDVANGARWLAQWGAQTASYSGSMAGSSGPLSLPANSNCPQYQYDPDLGAAEFCAALQFMEERDVLFFAAAGNHKQTQIHFPARDPKAIAIGGLDVNLQPWDEANWRNDEGDNIYGCPKVVNPDVNSIPATTTLECGQNDGPELDFIAPARRIISTTTRGGGSASICQDANFSTAGDGYGFCTGTSMATPHVNGLAALLRSILPIAPKSPLVNLLRRTASSGGLFLDNAHGYGMPNAALAVEQALGKSGGQQLRNRLTPLFLLRNVVDGDRLYTTNPQLASGATHGEYLAEPQCARNPLRPAELICDPSEAGPGSPRPYIDPISPIEAPLVLGPDVYGWGGYFYPGVDSDMPMARSPFYVFTTDKSPFPGVTMKPLHRLVFAQVEKCDLRDHVYTTNANDSVRYTNPNTGFCDGVALDQNYPTVYLDDGIEGYVMASCPSVFGACNDPDNGAVPQPVYRRYSPTEKSFALLLGSQLVLLC